jgi:hypothetical protein
MLLGGASASKCTIASRHQTLMLHLTALQFIVLSTLLVTNASLSSRMAC